MSIISTLLLALAVSLDGLGVGISYGLRGLRLPWVSLILITFISIVASFFSMLFGKASTLIFPPHLAQKIGAALLLGLGCEILLESYLKGKGEDLQNPRTLLQVRVPRLGLIIAILQEPAKADLDSSGSISPGEALALGLALALDAFGVGLGAGATGFSLTLTPLFIGCTQLILVSAGLWIGRRWHTVSWGKKGAALPGVILISLGLWRW
ncbi:putative sporulation protein YtaF [Thermanaeromonas toyohensis ToBE]|uniref:Putative sporulation protein YtaF n=1 Tax=Thermanaeromonas toyohensis ToBE TaxID=698762 RepID=A0A1W1W0L1_9FIRM|nr:sporulation membrane protein YtaF [Thermanaeromonas toyohensis]SMB99116.1 putative sporulation protein YtaF [Thermanaeromonas toyohensis ToBE]